jgi:ABC-type microcin C transport system permease subunit YejB
MCCVGLAKKTQDYKQTTTTLDAAVRNIKGQHVFRNHDVPIICLEPHIKIHQFFNATVLRRRLVALR